MADVVTQETDAQAAPAPTQDTAPESQTTVQPAPTEPSQGNGPWAKDLADIFPDESLRTQVDGFLRQKVQPYVTQLEGQRGNEEAERLFKDLQDDPADTYLSITGALFGDEAAEQVQTALFEYYGDDEPADAEALPDEHLDPRVAALIEKDEAEERQRLYDENLEQLKAKHPDDALDDELLAPFIIAAEGDMEAAYEGYRKFAARFTGDTNENQLSLDVPVIGSDTASHSAPPVAKKYGSIDEALDDTFAELAAARRAPETVGST